MLIAKFIPAGALRSMGRASLQLKKHAPEILTAVGVVGSVASGVLFVRAGIKTVPIVEEHVDVVKQIKEMNSTEEEMRKDVTHRYVQTGIKLAKVYGPPLVLGAVSISAIVGGHRILNKRNAAIAMAYKALETSYQEYRDRVSAELGPDTERDIYRSAEVMDVEDEKGKKVPKMVQTGKSLSPYAKIFDKDSPNFERVPAYNINFLRTQEKYFNQRLHAKGHVFLNEVYDALGLPRTSIGQMAGWMADGEEGYISFDLFELDSDNARRFLNGHDDGIWLDFNVDGLIYELI